MSRSAALLHLFLRDVRQHRQVVLGFAVAVLATALATFAPTGFQLVALGTSLLADLFVALVVLEHHPGRVNTLWVGLPIDRAVTLANVALVALGIPFALALIGQAGLFALFDVPLPSAAVMLFHGGTALVRSLLVAVGIALVAGSLRFFFVGVALWMLLSTVVSTALWYFVYQEQSFQVSVRQPITLVSVVSGLTPIVLLAIPIVAFRTRSMTPSMKWLTVGTLIAMQVSSLIRGPFVPPMAPLPHEEGPTPVIAMNTLPADIPGLFTFALSASGHPEGSRVVFRPDTVSFLDAGGHVIASGIAVDRRPIQVYVPRLPSLHDLAVIQGPDSTEQSVVRIRPYGTLPPGVVRMALGGDVEVLSPESTHVRVPLNPRAFAPDQGRLTIVDSVHAEPGLHAIHVRRSTISSHYTLGLLARTVTFALVHPGRSEVVWVNPTDSDMTQSGSILPGISATTERTTLTTGFAAGGYNDRLGSSVEVTAAWLQGAHLAVVSWNSRGSVRTETSVHWPLDSSRQPVATSSPR